MKTLLAPRLTIGISDTRVWIRHERPLRRSPVDSFEIAPRAGSGWPSLREVLTSYMTAASMRTASARVVLLPPLVSGRVLEFPRLTRDELVSILSRNPDRYFPNAREPQALASIPIIRRRSKPMRVFAVAAPLSMLRLIKSELAACGITASDVVSAHESWLASALRERRTRVVVAASGASAEIMELKYRRLSSIRRVRPETLVDYRIEPNGSRPAVAIFGKDNGIARYFIANRDYTVNESTCSSGEVAVVNAHRARRLQLREPEEAAQRNRTDWKRAIAMFAVAIVMLVAAAGLESRRQETRLSEIRKARSDIMQTLGQAIDVQHAAWASRDELQLLQGLELGSERWTKLITQVARELPLDTRLVNLRERGDTITLEGYSFDPQTAFRVMRETALFNNLIVANPIVREKSPGNDPQLRFVFQGTVRRAGVP